MIGSTSIPDSPTPAIDWEQLDMIAYGYTPEFFAIFDMFLAQVPSLLLSAEEAAHYGDMARLGYLAHQIKGTAANFGFDAVRHPMATLERACSQGNAAESAALIAEARVGFHTALAEFRAQRGNS